MKKPNYQRLLPRQIKASRIDRRDRIRNDLSRYGKVVLESEEMKKAYEQTHHLWSTVGEHTLRVAFTSVLICYALRKLKIKVNIPEVVVGSLCHDLGILGRDKKYSSQRECGREHPRESVVVADELIEDLSDKTKDIIERHMWPIGTAKVPNSIEGAVVSYADKYNSIKDIIKGSDVKRTGVRNYVSDKKEKIKDRVKKTTRQQG